jgi:hypothetical protein
VTSAGDRLCYRIGMSWLLPDSLLLIAGAAALVLLPALIRRPVRTPRLVVETLGTPLGVTALFWLG